MKNPLLAIWLAFPLMAAATAAGARCPGQVGVAYGQTLGSIAQSCGTNIEALKQVNPGLNEQTLQNGTFLNVPRPALPTPPVEFRGNQRIVQPARRPYIIRAGDTLSAIAQGFGVSVPELQEVNPGLQPDRLRIGQPLHIPGGPFPPLDPANPNPPFDRAR